MVAKRESRDCSPVGQSARRISARSVVRIYPGPPVGWIDAGWSSPVARWAHNPKVAGSNPAPATNFETDRSHGCLSGGVAQLAEHMVCNHGVRGSTPLTSTSNL